MVLIESGSADAAGLAKMADYVEARLKALGARTERIAAGARPRSESSSGNFTGSGTKKLMLMAHMDTVYATGTSLTSRTARTATRSMGPASPTTRAASPSSSMRWRS